MYSSKALFFNFIYINRPPLKPFFRKLFLLYFVLINFLKGILKFSFIKSLNTLWSSFIQRGNTWLDSLHLFETKHLYKILEVKEWKKLFVDKNLVVIRLILFSISKIYFFISWLYYNSFIFRVINKSAAK